MRSPLTANSSRRAFTCFRSSVLESLPREQAIIRRQKLARLLSFPLIAPQPGHAHCGAIRANDSRRASFWRRIMACSRGRDSIRSTGSSEGPSG